MEKNLKYGYNDISIVPEKITRVEHRFSVNPFDEDGNLPIFTAPMDTIVDEKNIYSFINNSIIPVIPRNISFEIRYNFLKNSTFFVAFSLTETEMIFLQEDFKAPYGEFRKFLKREQGITHCSLCIDVANGHMKKLIDVISKIKNEYGDSVKIMSGNIANPETYEAYNDAKCDYVRVSIGTGEGCTTSTKTGIHYPIFSLLKETYDVKRKISGTCKIIADGGIKSFGDIQKALIYADYVMIGGLFSKMKEASGPIYTKKWYVKIGDWKISNLFKNLFFRGREDKKPNWKAWKKGKVEYYRKFRGMSTKEAQAKINKAEGTFRPLKESEGTTKIMPVEFELEKWKKEEESALRSAMSYTDSFSLEEYKDSLWVPTMKINYNH